MISPALHALFGHFSEIKQVQEYAGKSDMRALSTARLNYLNTWFQQSKQRTGDDWTWSTGALGSSISIILSSHRSDIII